MDGWIDEAHMRLARCVDCQVYGVTYVQYFDEQYDLNGRRAQDVCPYCGQMFECSVEHVFHEWRKQ